MSRLQKRAIYDLATSAINMITGIVSAYLGWAWFALFFGFLCGGLVVFALTEFRDDAAIKIGRFQP